MTAPCAASSGVGGSPLAAGALGAKHAAAIGSVHRLVHRAVPERQGVLVHARLREVRALLMRDGCDGYGGSPEVVVQAWREARAWLADVDVDQFLASGRRRFSRGDPNLSNYLWSEGGLVLVDWETSGRSDPALELADMAEHASTRAVSDEAWTDVADATELTTADRARVAEGRRLMACFWLVLVESRQRDGCPTTVTLVEQAHRTLVTLGA